MTDFDPNLIGDYEAFLSSPPETFKSEIIHGVHAPLTIQAHVLETFNENYTVDSYTVDLSHKRITYLEAASLNEFKQLLILDLGHNLLSSINPITFNRLKKLKILSLNNNSLTFIYPTTFSALNALVDLDLSANKFKLIDSASIFDGLKSLRHLNLSHNQLESIL